MAQSKSGKNKDSSKGSTKKQSAEVKAEEALARAYVAVQQAADATKGARKKLRAEASELAQQTEKLIAKHAKAERKVEKAAKKADKAAALKVSSSPDKQQTTRSGGRVLVIPEVDQSTAASSAPEPAGTRETAASSARAEQVDVESLTPPLPSPQPAAPTLITLRERARIAKVPGYSRMNKAALIAALGATPSS